MICSKNKINFRINLYILVIAKETYANVSW